MHPRPCHGNSREASTAFVSGQDLWLPSVYTSLLSNCKWLPRVIFGADFTNYKQTFLPTSSCSLVKAHSHSSLRNIPAEKTHRQLDIPAEGITSYSRTMPGHAWPVKSKCEAIRRKRPQASADMPSFLARLKSRFTSEPRDELRLSKRCSMSGSGRYLAQ